MSADNKSLNQQNNLYLMAYIVTNILLFSALTLNITFNETILPTLEKLISSTSLSLIFGVFTIVINGQLSPHLKAILVFWKLQDPLPGCRAFSHLMEKDVRIDPAILTSKHSNLPTVSSEQNCLWYKIYKKHEDKLSVENSQRNFLLARDLAALSFLFSIIFSISGCFLIESTKVKLFYFASLFLMFLLTSQAARNYGVCFVRNVLAEETSA